MKLSHDVVNELLRHCLAGANADTEDRITVEGIVANYVLSKSRLAEKREDLRALLGELHPTFREGWTFLNLAMDKHGNQWGEHPAMEALCVMAIGAGLGEWTLGREFWPALHGGMPYFTILKEEAVPS